jgi:hypothetical protein
VFATGFESWPWAMEAGLGAEHRAFWTSVVDWLAGGLTEDATLDGEVGQPWVRWTGRLEGDVPAALVLTRPEGVAGPDGVTRPGGTRPGDARSVEAVSPGRAAGGATVVSFVPVAEGGHRLEASGSAGGEEAAAETAGGETAGGETSAAEPVLPAPTFGAVAAPSGEPMTWTAAALELGTAGARIVRSDDPARRDDARPTAPPRALTWLLFLGLAAGAVTAWATRRIAGRP